MIKYKGVAFFLEYKDVCYVNWKLRIHYCAVILFLSFSSNFLLFLLFFYLRVMFSIP